MKYLLGIVIIALLGIGGYYAWGALSQPIVPESAPQPHLENTSTYATSTFSIRYPSTYSVNDAYAYDQFAGKPIAGVKFTISETVATGTNLSSYDTGVSVEWLPRARSCTGDIFIVPNVKTIDLTVGSTTYSVATTTGAGAGNFYEEQVFALKGSKPCTAVRYFIHSSNIGNFDPGAVAAFDRGALLSTFDAIRDSLTLVP